MIDTPTTRAITGSHVRTRPSDARSGTTRATRIRLTAIASPMSTTGVCTARNFRMIRVRLTAPCLAFLTLGALTAHGAVRTLPAAAAVGTIVLAAAGVSLDQAVAMVQQRFNARVV